MSKTRNELIKVRNQLLDKKINKDTKLKLLRREGELETELQKKHNPRFYDGILCKYCGLPITGIKHGNTKYHEQCMIYHRQDQKLDYKRTYDRKYRGIPHNKNQIIGRRTIAEHRHPNDEDEIKTVHNEYMRTLQKNRK